MYLKKSKSNKTGRTYLYIADGYYDKEKGYSKTKTIKSLGYLDILEKQYDDPIAHFTEVVKKMNEEKKNNSTPLTLKKTNVKIPKTREPIHEEIHKSKEKSPVKPFSSYKLF